MALAVAAATLGAPAAPVNAAPLALLIAAAVWCLCAPPLAVPRAARGATGGTRRVLLSGGVALGGSSLVGWWALAVGLGAWWWLRRTAADSGSPGAPNGSLPAREQARLRRELPHLVALMVGPLRSGAAPVEALRRACAALPGPAADRLGEPLALIGVGVDPLLVWEQVAIDPVIGSLGRALVRAERSGAAVTPSVERLAAELASASAQSVEDRARTVGVRAAVPLGLCLLPAFLLLGVVPLAVGLFDSVLTG